MAKTKRKSKRTNRPSANARNAADDSLSHYLLTAEDDSVSKGILPVELTHSIIARALGNYYTDLILYKTDNMVENGEPDVPLAMLHVSRLFRMETIRLMWYLFAESRDIVDVRLG